MEILTVLMTIDRRRRTGLNFAVEFLWVARSSQMLKGEKKIRNFFSSLKTYRNCDLTMDEYKKQHDVMWNLVCEFFFGVSFFI